MTNLLKFLYIMLIFTLFSSCYNPEDYINLDNNEIIYLDQKNITILADGVNAAPIEATISNKAMPNKRSVVFKTDLGFFKNGKGDSIVITANESFKSTAYLASLSTGTAKVSSKILGVTAKNSYTVTFEKAYPEKINVSVDSFAISNNYKSEILITASMGTNNGGRPSEGHEITFSATNELGNPVGDFLNNNNIGTSNIEGKVFIRFSVGKLDQDGYLTINAETNTSTSTISDSTRIYVLKK